jgi:hypothetical protein
MITHVVLLRPKTEVPEDQILSALDRVVRLQQTIPGIIAVQAGKNLSNVHQGFTYGFVMQFVEEASELRRGLAWRSLVRYAWGQ